MQKLNKEFTPKDLELEIQDTLNALFYGDDHVLAERRFLSVRSMSAPSFKHNYQRENWQMEGHYYLRLDGETVAEIRLKPHLTVKIYSPSEELRYPVKILERTLSTHFPEATVKFEWSKKGSKPDIRTMSTNLAGASADFITFDEVFTGEEPIDI